MDKKINFDRLRNVRTNVNFKNSGSLQIRRTPSTINKKTDSFCQAVSDPDSSIPDPDPAFSAAHRFFLFLWIIFAPLDPDPESESGSNDLIESGSNQKHCCQDQNPKTHFTGMYALLKFFLSLFP